MTTQLHKRTTGLAVALAVAVGIAAPAVLSLSATPASATTVPTFSVSPRAIDIPAGGFGQLVIRFSRNRPAIRWSISGLPPGVQAGFGCSSARACELSLVVSPGVSRSTSLVELILSSGSSRRLVPFALGVHSNAIIQSPVPAPVPIPAPTAPPVTTPPVTLPTVPQPQPVTVRNFSLQPTILAQSVRPGANVSFTVNIARVEWSGPVDLRVETLPPTWRAAFVPTNPTSDGSTMLLLSVPASTPVGDYPIRISGQVGSTVSTSNLTVQVRVPRPSLTVQSAPSIEAGKIGRFVLDARSLDDPRLPVTLSVEGLPVGVTPTYTANPAAGSVGIDLAVDSAVGPGNYTLVLVASRDGASARVPTVLTVTPAVSTAFKFVTTAVTPVPGERVSYGLSASTSNLIVARGTLASLDVRVSPTGGFSGIIDVAMDLPPGWTVVYSVVGINVFRANLTVPVNSPVGVAPIVIRSANGLLAASINLTATVR